MEFEFARNKKVSKQASILIWNSVKQFKPTLFNKYSDNLQAPQICQVGEYACVKIQNVIGTKIPVKTNKQKIQEVAPKLCSSDCF